MPVAGWLAYCALGGFDLRLMVMAVCWRQFGEDFVWRVIISDLLFGSYAMAMTGVMCGPLTLIWVLVAMHLSPRRWAWWQWSAISIWLLLNPWLCLQIARLIPVRWAGWFGWIPPTGLRRVVAVGQVYAVVMAQLLVLGVIAWLVLQPLRSLEFRSRWRWAPAWLVGFGMILGTFQWWADWPSTQVSVPLPWAAWIFMGILWHSASAVLLIGGAIAARRGVAHESWRCLNCGYDLRGLELRPPRCPECGFGTAQV